MRSAGGIEVIKTAIDGLSKYHDRHIMLYDPTLVSSPLCVCVCGCMYAHVCVYVGACMRMCVCVGACVHICW